MNLKLDPTIDPQNVMKAFAELLQKTASGTPSGPYMHGPGGLFGVRGLERDVISTHTNITGSLGEAIPMQPSQDMNPLFPYITGFIRSDTQEKNSICDDPEEAGNMKTCIQTTVFGRKEFKTRELEINRIGQRINRGEFMDLNIVNSPLVNQMAGLMSGFFGLNNQAAILAGREMTARFVEVGVAYQRWFCPTVFTGNPANSSAGGGYKEFMGLDMLIGTNKVDALTGSACPSLYSDVKSFGYKNISSTDDPDIVRTLQTMLYILETRARQNNMMPVDFRIVMRSPLFYELTRYWPQQYMTDSGASTLAQLSYYRESVAMRDAMREGLYLTINGKNYPVILDDCIIEENRADNGNIPIGGFASDIYIVPFSARGGSLRTLYWEYYDFRRDALPDMAGLPMYFWSDNGVFMWGMTSPKNWCLDVISKVEPRLILRTPQLAGRLTDVVYVPLQHPNDPLPSQDYWTNGGVATGRPFPSPFSEYNLSGPGSGA